MANKAKPGKGRAAQAKAPRQAKSGLAKTLRRTRPTRPPKGPRKRPR